jgi:hypothetical protein
MKLFLGYFTSSVVLAQLYEQFLEAFRIIQVIYDTRQRIHNVRSVGSQLLAGSELRQRQTLEIRE